LDSKESKKTQKKSKTSSKKETLDIISEENVKNSRELPSTSSHDTGTKQRTSNEHSDKINEANNNVESKSEITPNRRGRGKKETNDDMQENKMSDNSNEVERI
jgi:hypothetical protein